MQGRRAIIGWIAGAATAAPAAPRLRLMINDVAPYSSRQNGVLVGMHVDMMRAIGAAAGEDFKWSSALYARLIRALPDKAADLVLALEGPDIGQQGQFLGRVHAVRYLILPRSGLELQDVSQLRGRTLGLARGAFYGEEINDDAQIRKIELHDPFYGVRMLSMGRLDAVISSDYLLSHALRQTGIQRESFGRPLFFKAGAYGLFARRDIAAERGQSLSDAIARLTSKGRLAELARAYE